MTAQTQSSITDSSPTLVSVIIGNYNYGQYISRAIESVLGQTYGHIELIVIDDGSSDNSRDVIASYGDRLTAIYQDNSGQGAAFNVGIQRAQGEIICFLDSDDYCRQDKVERIVAAFHAHPQWVQISHGRTTVDSQGRAIGSGSKRHSQGDVRSLLLRWGRYSMGITSTLAYRRNALVQVLPIPERAVGADTYLTAAIPFLGSVGAIEEPLTYYRIHGQNRQAHQDNIDFLIWQRQLNASFINQWAAKTGVADRFNLARDADYRSLQAAVAGERNWTEILQVSWLSLCESFAIGRSPKDTLERLLRRGICTFSPNAGRGVLRLGLRRYLRAQFLALLNRARKESILPS